MEDYDDKDEENDSFKFKSSAEYLSYKPGKQRPPNNTINEDKYFKSINMHQPDESLWSKKKSKELNDTETAPSTQRLDQDEVFR